MRNGLYTVPITLGEKIIGKRDKATGSYMSCEVNRSLSHSHGGSHACQPGLFARGLLLLSLCLVSCLVQKLGLRTSG